MERTEIENQIKELKTKLTGRLMDDMEINNEIHVLTMKLNNVKPTDSHFDCVGCGS